MASNDRRHTITRINRSITGVHWQIAQRVVSMTIPRLEIVVSKRISHASFDPHNFSSFPAGGFGGGSSGGWQDGIRPGIGERVGHALRAACEHGSIVHKWVRFRFAHVRRSTARRCKVDGREKILSQSKPLENLLATTRIVSPQVRMREMCKYFGINYRFFFIFNVSDTTTT